MSLVLKVALSLALALPATAYVVGSLAASAEDPAPRETIVIERSADTDPAGDRTKPAKPRDDDGRKEDASPTAVPTDDPDDDDSDDLDTVEPEIEDLDDDSSGHGSGDDDDEDDRDDGDDDRDDD